MMKIMMTKMMLIYLTILLQLFEAVNFSFFSAEEKLEFNFDDISNILDMNDDGFWKSQD